MKKNTIQNKALVYFVIVVSSIIVTNGNALAGIQIDIWPIKYSEYVTLYRAAPRSGEDDLLPEQLEYDETYQDLDPPFNKYGIYVDQHGYVLTALAPFGFGRKEVPFIKISDTTSVTIASALPQTTLEVQDLDARSTGIIHFYGRVINTSDSGPTRAVPIPVYYRSSVDISPTGKAIGTVKVQMQVRGMNSDYTYKPGYIVNTTTWFCKSIGNVYNRTCYWQAYEPGVRTNFYTWFIEVAPGATELFEYTLTVITGPDILAVADAGGFDESAVHFDINVDPFLYIDPEWEYADEYTLELSPGMYVGPPYDLPEIISALQMLVGMEKPLGDQWISDINGDGKIGLAEIIYMLQFVSGRR